MISIISISTIFEVINIIKDHKFGKPTCKHNWIKTITLFQKHLIILELSLCFVSAIECFSLK